MRYVCLYFTTVFCYAQNYKTIQKINDVCEIILIYYKKTNIINKTQQNNTIQNQMK